MPVRAALEAASRRLRAAGRRSRLAVSRQRLGRGDDGPLRRDEFPAHPARGGQGEGRGKPAPRLDVGLPGPPDRRAERRAEEARLPRPRAGPGRAGDPARRAVHRRGREDRGGDHRAAPRTARETAASSSSPPTTSAACRNSATRWCSINRTVLAYGADGGGVHRTESHRGLRRRAAAVPVRAIHHPGARRPARSACSPTTSARWSSARTATSNTRIARSTRNC